MDKELPDSDYKITASGSFGSAVVEVWYDEQKPKLKSSITMEGSHLFQTESEESLSRLNGALIGLGITALRKHVEVRTAKEHIASISRGLEEAFENKKK